MLEERGHKFVRYADNCNIYVKSSRTAERVMESCTKFLKGKLKVNSKESMTGRPHRAQASGIEPLSATRKEQGYGYMKSHLHGRKTSLKPSSVGNEAGVWKGY
jgi:hypothetical protein